MGVRDYYIGVFPHNARRPPARGIEDLAFGVLLGVCAANDGHAARPLRAELPFVRNHTDELWYGRNDALADAPPTFRTAVTSYDAEAKRQALSAFQWQVVNAATRIAHELPCESVAELAARGYQRLFHAAEQILISTRPPYGVFSFYGDDASIDQA